MASYWLTPILRHEPFTLGAERIRLEPQQAAQSLHARLYAAHPRALLLFKSNILPAEDSGEACGAAEATVHLSQPGDIVFNGRPLLLSHCAEALLDRLLPAGETLAALAAVRETDLSSSAVAKERMWLERMTEWLERGHDVILLKGGIKPA